MNNAAIKKMILGKPALLVLLVGVIIFGTIQYRQRTQRQDISNEINQLQQQQKDLEQKNQQLSDSLQYLNSSGYQDRIARQQLGLKKSGEVVYSFAPDAEEHAAAASDNRVANSSNVKAWWLYLFHNTND